MVPERAGLPKSRSGSTTVDPQRFKAVATKVLATTATIDNPGAQSMPGWRMHGDACARLGEHREAAKSFRKSVQPTWIRESAISERGGTAGPGRGVR